MKDTKQLESGSERPGILGVIGSSAVKGAAACPIWSLPSTLLSNPLSSHPLYLPPTHPKQKGTEPEVCKLPTVANLGAAGMYQTQRLFWSPLIFLSLDGSPMGPVGLGKSRSPHLRLCGFLFLRTPPPRPIKDQSLRHGPKPLPARQKVCI